MPDVTTHARHSSITTLNDLSRALARFDVPHTLSDDRILLPVPISTLAETWIAIFWMQCPSAGFLLTAPLAVADIADLPLAIEVVNAWNVGNREPKAFVVIGDTKCFLDGQIVITPPLQPDLPNYLSSTFSPFVSVILESAPDVFQPNLATHRNTSNDPLDRSGHKRPMSTPDSEGPQRTTQQPAPLHFRQTGRT